MSKHTPTPWGRAGIELIGNEGREMIGTLHDTQAGISVKENASFIVRAVNAHDELLHALRLAKALLEGQTEETEENVIELLSEVLAKVEGK